MRFYGKVVRCDNTECGLPVFRLKAGRTLSDDEIKDLLTEGPVSYTHLAIVLFTVMRPMMGAFPDLSGPLFLR